MIRCEFEDGGDGYLRHVTTDLIGLRDGHTLLVRRAAHLVEGGKWAIPGGYMNRDENLAECAAREFREETGYTCHDVRLFVLDSRPERPGNERQNVSGVFFAGVGERLHDGDGESTAVEWFPLDALPASGEMAFGHDRYFEMLKQYLEEPFALPLIDGARLPDS